MFLAFRSCDTKHRFATRLKDRLKTKGIKVFDNDDQSLIGKDVAHEIQNAIDRSKIYIPIISKNFASSRWCLEELARMVECTKATGKKIIPIFYEVRPSEVKKASGDFEEGLLRHKSYTSEQQNHGKWKRALMEVGEFSGLESEKIDNGYVLSSFPTKILIKSY